MVILESILVTSIVSAAAIFLVAKFWPKRLKGSGCGGSDCNCKAKDLLKSVAPRS